MAGKGLALFDEAHTFLKTVTDEVDDLRQFIASEDAKRQEEINQLRQDQEQERFERRDALNSLRYEFEDFVKRKIDKVVKEVSEMKRSGKADDNAQQQQINGLMDDFDTLKENLFNVQSAWGKLVSNCALPPNTDLPSRQDKSDNPSRSGNASRMATEAHLQEMSRSVG
mmetsp:Transcript_127853/g.319192  ORF Transcript_127853/g.319192 Transcript_127853/m.319192 type:complete len:169 (-) Transcript_127853:54-560(-)|eukprot:CAMPEP_0115271524 /NCGR_PEP_ID=MMETSP0270-20121206/54148_1 /TAXON_ID=71861 /ORGANISM="Scrippsiella trochoidea, Strain CCMP3099" /LENGTH=168 /DNA_ID=CAMNT_0002687895 /DNA_START=44 /DNA_END=550 /DNA_ORIENTATION=-